MSALLEFLLSRIRGISLYDRCQQVTGSLYTQKYKENLHYVRMPQQIVNIDLLVNMFIFILFMKY